MSELRQNFRNPRPESGAGHAAGAERNSASPDRSRTASSPSNFALMIQLFRRHLLLLLVPVGLFSLVAAIYVLVRPPAWKATQTLRIRDELALQHDLSGRFASLDMMKMVQETLHETVRRHAVVAEVLRQVDPPPRYAQPEQWPSIEDIEEMQGSISLSPPNGAPFGQTEILLLSVTDSTKERAGRLVALLAGELQSQVNQQRDQRASSIEHELEENVRLATAELEASSQKLSAFEKGLGEMLVDLRAISNDIGSGGSGLQSRLNGILTESRAARQSFEVLSRQLRSIRQAAEDPGYVLSFSSELLAAQPALSKLKEELIRIQSQTAGILGQFEPYHPKAKAALESEAVVKRKILDEIQIAEQGLVSQTEALQDQIDRLSESRNELESQLQKLAELRAPYSALVNTVSKKREILNRALEDLARARAARVAATTTHLITLVDEPYTGSRPEGMSRKLIVGVSGLAGLLSGIGLVLFAASPGFVGGLLGSQEEPNARPDRIIQSLPSGEPSTIRRSPAAALTRAHQADPQRRAGESAERDVQRFDFGEVDPDEVTADHLADDLEVDFEEMEEIVEELNSLTTRHQQDPENERLGQGARYHGPSAKSGELESAGKGRRNETDEEAGCEIDADRVDSGSQRERKRVDFTEDLREDGESKAEDERDIDWNEQHRRKIERMFRDED